MFVDAYKVYVYEKKSATVGIIYRQFPTNSNENFPNLDTLKKQLYILGDFNINSYQNQNHIGCKNNTLVAATVSNNAKNYLQFCTMFGLTQIIKSPTRLTCTST